MHNAPRHSSLPWPSSAPGTAPSPVDVDRTATARPACPVCGGHLGEQRGKLICSTCHRICETCCEGGRE